MLACPDCQNSRAVRALALDDRLVTHLALLALPVLIIAAISLLFYRSAERRQPEASQGARPIDD